MNKYFKILFLVFITLSFNSCKDSGSPESITELFLISYKNMDFITMKNISTRNTRDLIKIFEHYTKDSVLAHEWENKYEDIDIKIHGKTIINDTAVYVQFETSPDIFPIQEIRLVQISEKLDKKSWKVDISTIDIADRDNVNSEDTMSTRTSVSGQIHPDADSVAAQE